MKSEIVYILLSHKIGRPVSVDSVYLTERSANHAREEAETFANKNNLDIKYALEKHYARCD